MIDPQRPPTQVTLEDLLRLKRAERPKAEFWLDFERSLRAKQLAAIVEKRPWWSSWNQFSRWSIPVGATAVLALTFATVRSFYPQAASDRVAVASSETTLPVQQSAAVIPREALVQTNTQPDTLATIPLPDIAAPSQLVAATLPAQAPTPTADPVSTREVASPTRLASVTEQIAGIGLDPEIDLEKTASPRFASVVQKEAAAAAEDLNAFFEHAVANLDSSMRSEKVAVVEPLSQIPSPRDSRRARLLAFTSTVDTHSPQYSNNSNVIRSRERITSHLSEEALYDSIRRLDIKNGGVSIQF